MADKRNSTSYIIIFSVVICAIGSLGLSMVQASLKERQDTNAQNYLNWNIVKVLGLKAFKDEGKTQKIGPAEIAAHFDEKTGKIKELLLNENGEVLKTIKVKGLEKPGTFANMDKQMKRKKTYRPLYVLEDENGKPLKYAIPISGNGLWGLMWGFLAIDADLKTVSGITFYNTNETPGLGKEVEEDWFQNQFNNPESPISCRNAKGELVDVKLIKGGVNALYPDPSHPMRKHSVDGISGATITANGLNKFLNEDLRVYENIYFSKINKAKE